MTLLPAEVDDSHRGRLLAAMAQAIREHGYGPTTVAEVVAGARTSRRTFYQHFEDRESCFLALFDVLTERLLGVIAEAATGEGPYEERMERTLRAWLDAAGAEPMLMRSLILELPAIGPAGVARDRAMTERTARQLRLLVADAAEHDPGVRALTPETALVVVGGFRELIATAIEDGRAPGELLGVTVDVVRRITLRAG